VASSPHFPTSHHVPPRRLYKALRHGNIETCCPVPSPPCLAAYRGWNEVWLSATPVELFGPTSPIMIQGTSKQKIKRVWHGPSENVLQEEPMPRVLRNRLLTTLADSPLPRTA